jgi:hypothetical protein
MVKYPSEHGLKDGKRENRMSTLCNGRICISLYIFLNISLELEKEE